MASARPSKRGVSPARRSWQHAQEPRTPCPAAQLGSRARCGVHLNFGKGDRITSCASLVDERGNFHGKRALFLRAVRGTLSLKARSAEVTAQIARINEARIRISHVDGHKTSASVAGPVRNAVACVPTCFGIGRVRLDAAHPAGRRQNPRRWCGSVGVEGAEEPSRRPRDCVRRRGVAICRQSLQPVQRNGRVSFAGPGRDRLKCSVTPVPGRPISRSRQLPPLRRAHLSLSRAFQELPVPNRAHPLCRTADILERCAFSRSYPRVILDSGHPLIAYHVRGAVASGHEVETSSPCDRRDAARASKRASIASRGPALFHQPRAGPSRLKIWATCCVRQPALPTHALVATIFYRDEEGHARAHRWRLSACRTCFL